MDSSKKSPRPDPQYRVVIDIQAPIDQCFVAGTAEDAMLYWVPGAVSVVYDHSGASQSYGAGSQRVVTLKGGMTLLERVDVSHPPTFMSYSLPSLGAFGDRLLSGYHGHMNFEDLGNGLTRLSWEGYFECSGLQKLAEPVLRRATRGLITRFAKRMKTYLER